MSAPEQTPFDTLKVNLDAVDEALEPLQVRGEEIEKEFNERRAENKREIAATESGRQRALDDFYQGISEAPELYRSVFQLIINEERIKQFTGKKNIPELVASFEFVDRKARELNALAHFLERLEDTAPALLIKTVRHDLVANPSCLSYPTEHDLVRSQAYGIKATIGQIKPCEELSIEHSSIFKPSKGRSTIAEQISLPVARTTSIETQLAEFDHDVWMSDQPQVEERGDQEIELLSSNVRIGLGLNSTPSVKVEGSIDAIEAPLRLSLFVGKVCAEQVLEILNGDTKVKYDRRALRALETAYQELNS